MQVSLSLSQHLASQMIAGCNVTGQVTVTLGPKVVA